MLRNTRVSYGLISQLLHWVTAVLILILIPLGIYMHELPANTAIEAADKSWFYSLHKTLGVTALIVAVIRIFWAITQSHPVLLNEDKPIESLAARTVHWTLYGAIIAMPLTGWLYHSATEGFAPIWWPFAQDLPFITKTPQLAKLFQAAHVFTGVLLGACVVLHIAGALKHALIDRDDTIRRMIPGLYRPQQTTVQAPRIHRLPIVLAALAFLLLGSLTVANHFVGQPGSETVVSGTTTAGPSTNAWLVDRDKSQLAIEILQSGKPIAGAFQSWSAAINLDPEDLASARIDVTIDIASLTLGSVSAQALSSNFLNAAEFPHARFVSQDIVRISAGSYEARGELTVAGRTGPVTLPFTLMIADGRAAASGKVALDRLAFGIGSTGFSGGNVLGVKVLVRISLEATRRQ